ncbi:MAG: HAD family hydrolase [Spirochaetia bacterium]
MRILQTVSRVSGVIFDIDNTLYRHNAYMQAQTDLLVDRLATELGKSPEHAAEEVEAVRESYARGNDGRRPSLANTFIEFGIDIETSIRWRTELFDPCRYLGSDPMLQKALTRIAKGAAIVAVTNNPASVGTATLSCLGVLSLFRGVVGLDTTGVSKPHRAPFERGLELLGPGVRADEVVSVGDRVEVDLEPAMELGMGAILVESMQDVYGLSFEDDFAGVSR